MGSETRPPQGKELQPAGEVVQRVVSGLKTVEAVCMRCQAPMVIASTGRGGAQICAPCIREQADRERLSADRARFDAEGESWLDAYLIEQGLSKRELQARLDRIPPALGQMLDSVAPDSGFGLSGEAGTGKTFAIAALFREWTMRRWAAQVERTGLRDLRKSWFSWIAWPEAVNRIRTLSTRDRGMIEAEEWIEAKCDAPCLVIDDIGAERIRGSYETDWAASQLDRIVDARYNEMLPIWYTTNLPRNVFLEQYGSRFFSRLTSENRFLTLKPGPDLRFVGAPRK